jgi:GGDEF domain-containing protein
VISLKKFLARDESDAESPSRIVWLILEAVACHAIEADPEERKAFQDSLRAVIERMEQSTKSADSLVLAGEAIRSIETYNRDVQRSLKSQVREMQSIVSLFSRSMLQVSKSSAASAHKLHQIERQIEKSSQCEDLKAIKVQLERSLVNICEEAAAQERRSAEINDQIQDAINRPESAAALSEAVGDFDLVTGLPNFRDGERAIRAAIAAGGSTYAIMLSVDRLEVINGRFGFAVGDRILMLFGQHLAQRFSKSDSLFRWRGPAFLALLDRQGPEISVRAEIARMVAARMDQEIELGGRSVLLPITSSWMITNVAGSTVEKITQKLDAFSTGQTPA